MAAARTHASLTRTAAATWGELLWLQVWARRRPGGLHRDSNGTDPSNLKCHKNGIQPWSCDNETISIEDRWALIRRPVRVTPVRRRDALNYSWFDLLPWVCCWNPYTSASQIHCDTLIMCLIGVHIDKACQHGEHPGQHHSKFYSQICSLLSFSSFIISLNNNINITVSGCWRVRFVQNRWCAY